MLKPLRASFVRACYDSGKTHLELTYLGGFKHRSQLTTILLASRARYSEIVVERLQRIADAIGFTDTVFR